MGFLSTLTKKVFSKSPLKNRVKRTLHSYRLERDENTFKRRVKHIAKSKANQARVMDSKPNALKRRLKATAGKRLQGANHVITAKAPRPHTTITTKSVHAHRPITVGGTKAKVRGTRKGKIIKTKRIPSALQTRTFYA